MQFVQPYVVIRFRHNDVEDLEKRLRRRLWENANMLYQHLQELDFDVGPEPSPIVAVRLEDKAEALGLWSGLLERGIYVNLVLPPATPDGNCLLRSSVSAGHTPDQMDRICQAFTTVKELTAASQTV